jgi:hypothetical protein
LAGDGWITRLCEPTVHGVVSLGTERDNGGVKPARVLISEH